MSIISLSETHKDLHNKIVDTFEEKLVRILKSLHVHMIIITL